MTLSFPSINPRRAVELLASMTAFVVVVGAAWRLGGWLWLVMAPAASVAGAEMQNEINVALIADRPWFGVRVAQTPATSQPARGTTLRLVGIFAGGRRPAAILGNGSNAPQAFLEGEMIVPGITLKTVGKDHVIVTRDGLSERIDFPVKAHDEINNRNTASEEPKE